MFYKIINAVSSTPIIPGARDFRVMTKQVVQAVLSLSESQRFSKGLFSWVGFKTKYLPYKNVERQHGKTSWNFMSLLNYSLDGLVDYSDAPLTLVSGLGLVSFIGATIALIFIVIRAAIYGDPTAGWPSMVSIMLMMGGLQLLAIGIVGRYIGRIFLEVKKPANIYCSQNRVIKNSRYEIAMNDATRSGNFFCSYSCLFIVIAVWMR